MLKICIPIIETTVEKARRSIGEAHQWADLIELRVDYLKKPELKPLMDHGGKSFIVTNRRKEEGGRYEGDERRRFRILREAVELGAQYVDIEVKSSPFFLQDMISNKKRTRMILSFHNFQGTPSPGELRRLYDRMVRWRPDVVKVATLATSWEDNFKVLSLIPYARKEKQKIVAFCMGEKGRMSRIFAPMMGAGWTYASLNRNRISAPGQLTVTELREIWERLR
ncbi:MAG: type I 3-dehydroquinate dehydratase [Thermodesulfobacteriota bacterium]|nr:type I 3-dehydroquinate dehydratase [Thermodesulfobacteriota bacterium]